MVLEKHNFCITGRQAYSLTRYASCPGFYAVNAARRSQVPTATFNLEKVSFDYSMTKTLEFSFWDVGGSKEACHDDSAWPPLSTPQHKHGAPPSPL